MSDELEHLEHCWMEAVRARELETLDRLLAPEFTLTTGRAGAEVRTRDEYLRVTRDEYVLESFAFDELETDLYGDTAVVRSRYRQSGRMGGADRTQAFRLTDVWVRRDGRWLAASRHATPLEAERAPRAVAAAWFDAFAEGEPEAARPLLAADGVVHAADADLHGFDEALAWFQRRGALGGSDFSYRLDELLAGEHHAVALLTLSEGRREWRQVAVYRVEEGRIAEAWLYEDEPAAG